MSQWVWAMVTLYFIIIIIIIFRCWLCLQLQCWQMDSIRTAKSDHLAPNLIILLRTQSGILQGPETNWLFLPRQLILPFLFQSEAQHLFYWASATCSGSFWVAVRQRPRKVSGFALWREQHIGILKIWQVSELRFAVHERWTRACFPILAFPFFFFCNKRRCRVEERKCLTSQCMSFLCGQADYFSVPGTTSQQHLHSVLLIQRVKWAQQLN